MKLNIKLMAAVAVIAATLTSCGGNASELFGDLPKVYEEYEAEMEAVKESGNVDAKAFNEKYEQKFREAAEALNGKEISVSDEGEMKITSPITMTFDCIHSRGMSFKLEGEMEAADEIVRKLKHNTPYLEIYLVGYDSEGDELFRDGIAQFDFGKLKYADSEVRIEAGTRAEISSLIFYVDHAKDYPKAKELKLVVGEE